MARLSLGTIYGKLDEHQPQSVAFVSQRLNSSEEYEDGQKVTRFALRNRESSFAAQLTARGIRHEIFAASDLSDRASEIMTGNFDPCIVAGEVCSQSINLANRIRQAGFKRPIYLEITEEEALKSTSLEAASASASRLGATDLLAHFVYLTKTVRSPVAVEFPGADAGIGRDPYPGFTAELINTYKRAYLEAGYNAANFLRLIEERGGRDAAVYLIHQTQPPAGFVTLWERRRLDLSVEAIVLRPEWWPLFTDDDRAAAYARLREYEFDIPDRDWHPGRSVSADPSKIISRHTTASPPERTDVRVSRINRDTETARNLKQLYQYRCQICGYRIETRSGGFYIEVHHIHPLGGEIGGLDISENMLVLCPNHHALFDCGFVRFTSPTTVEFDGSTHRLETKHRIAEESITYHNAQCDKF